MGLYRKRFLEYNLAIHSAGCGDDIDSLDADGVALTLVHYSDDRVDGR